MKVKYNVPTPVSAKKTNKICNVFAKFIPLKELCLIKLIKNNRCLINVWNVKQQITDSTNLKLKLSGLICNRCIHKYTMCLHSMCLFTGDCGEVLITQSGQVTSLCSSCGAAWFSANHGNYRFHNHNDPCCQSRNRHNICLHRP